jgi:hypothetical protein
MMWIVANISWNHNCVVGIGIGILIAPIFQMVKTDSKKFKEVI